MTGQVGWVEVTHYHAQQLYLPLVKQLLQNQTDGSTCILTQTNEEAVILVALLRRNGVSSKLVQSLDGFRFNNLAEIKYFIKQINKTRTTPRISDQSWQLAKQATISTYNGSKSLEYVERCLEQFEQTNRVKYYNDFYEFVFESSIEDFCDLSGKDVIVSTIHKAKGREFDDVYMLIAGQYPKDATLMRRYYVGMTRARKRLFVHTNGDIFNNLPADRHLYDQNQYPMPNEVVLQLTHHDVYLNFFKYHKQEILHLRSGDPLDCFDNVLYNSAHHPVAKFSSNMQQTTYSKLNTFVAWTIFSIAAIVYGLTVEPTASLWDCPEFIACGYKLEIGHPPGAPVFMLAANLFSQFAADSSQVALMVNLLSALLSAGCIFFLFLTITHLAHKLICHKENHFTFPQIISVCVVILIGIFFMIIKVKHQKVAGIVRKHWVHSEYITAVFLFTKQVLQDHPRLQLTPCLIFTVFVAELLLISCFWA